MGQSEGKMWQEAETGGVVVLGVGMSQGNQVVLKARMETFRCIQASMTKQHKLGTSFCIAYVHFVFDACSFSRQDLM